VTFTVPLQYLGDGQFQATRGHATRCDKALTIGEVLTWEKIQFRSMKSHDHFFVCVDESWKNLPEAIAGEYPNSETLRKRILIKAGYCTESHFIFRDTKEAIANCAFMLSLDEYLMFEISGNIVKVWKAESQSLKAMGAKRFQESKEKVLELLSDLIGADASKAETAA